MKHRPHDLQVVEMPLQDVQQHPDNAHSADMGALELSITTNGFYDPIKVQKSTGYIIAGNHRYAAAIKMGWATIPAIVLDVDDNRAKRIMLADNRIGQLGVDDEAQLANLLDDLHASDDGLAGTGYDYDDYSGLMELINEPLTEDDFADTDTEVDLAPADVEALGKLGFTISPVVSEDGRCYEVTLSRHSYKHITKNDLNLLRKSLGQPPLNNAQLATYGVPDWER